MTKMTSSKIRKLLSQNEGPKLDFKQSLSLVTYKDKIELTKDICAIANTSDGDGHIILGIEDKTKRVLGINANSINEARLQQIVSSRSDPSPKFSIDLIPFKGVNLAIIHIPRTKLATLHQVKRIGFPIRRGSTTDTMTTTEIFAAVQTHAHRTRSRASEYEMFSSRKRRGVMRQDTLEGLLELGFDPKETKKIQQSYGMFVLTSRRINRRKIRLYFHFCSENADRSYIGRLQLLLDEIADKIPRHRTIFISIIHGSLSTAFLRSIIRDWGTLTMIPISPSITYFGVGTGVDEARYHSTLCQPRFYVQKVRSKEDIKARIQVILGWIEQHEDLFSLIYKSFRK